MFAIFAISAGLTYTLGRMAGSQKHGWAVFGAMAALFFAGILVCLLGRSQAIRSSRRSVDRPQAHAAGGNMEGKEARFGLANSTSGPRSRPTLRAARSTRCMTHTPLGGMVPLTNILLSEVIFGGVGAGMYGILIYVILSVFIAGLMVGRTPEYMGKKVEAYDVKMAMLNVLIFRSRSWSSRPSSGLACFGTSQLNNAGPHGLSEILYAFTSGTATTDRRSRGFRRTPIGTTRPSASPCCSGVSL